jgi:hypothetical protein
MDVDQPGRLCQHLCQTLGTRALRKLFKQKLCCFHFQKDLLRWFSDKTWQVRGDATATVAHGNWPRKALAYISWSTANVNDRLTFLLPSTTFIR